MKRYDFNSFEEFSDAEVAGEWEALTVVTENGWIKADLMTECKSWKTALRRFFKALDPDSAEEFEGWYECMRESAESGYFKMNDSRMADGSRNPYMSYAWEIEEMNDGEWYIFLNIHPGEYETEETEKNGTESTEETAEEAAETAETVEETEGTTETTTTETAESSETETADGTDSTSGTTAAKRTEANGRDGHERQQTPRHDSGNTLSALSALSANPPFLR